MSDVAGGASDISHDACDEQTAVCENITFQQSCLRAVINCFEIILFDVPK